LASNSETGNVRTPLDWPTPSAVPSASESEALTGGIQLVDLTEAAQLEVRRLIEVEGQPGLRLGIKGGGCSGLSYVLEFTEKREGDTVLDFDGFEVFLDKKSTIYLSGIRLDFQSGLNGRGFVFDNPQASNTCGCGESFSI
jgi:iron-sulfur cluster assembly protein